MTRNLRRGLVGVLGWLLSLSPIPTVSQPASDPDRTAIAVEALSKLEGIDLNSNPKLKAAVLKVLEATRGSPNFVKLVKKFHLSGQAAGLLELAVLKPSDESGVEAMQLLLEGGQLRELNAALEGTNVPVALHAVEALGNTGEQRVTPLLLPFVVQTKSDPALRKQAVRSLARTEAGASALLDAARQNQLAEDLKFTAAVELASVRWPKVKADAAEILPPPQGQNNQPLPPLSELLAQKGDAVRGAKVFFRETAVCSTCHRIQGRGGEVGPDLSEIGAKLGKDALYEAILDPSAGISFGYEAYELELKSGDEAYGLIVSETPEEVAIKDTRGVVTRHPKSDILSRRQMKLSIMPTGLQMTMSTQDLIDLVEFLSSLKKTAVGEETRAAVP
jgi:putative heme-binding domain-containing protein